MNVAPLTMCGGRDFSLLSVGQDDIFADTLKPAEDGSGDVAYLEPILVVRFGSVRRTLHVAKLHFVEKSWDRVWKRCFW